MFAPRIQDEDLLHLSQCKHLESLALSYTCLNGVGLNHLTNCSKLHTLRISSILLCKSDLSSLPNFTRLKHLKLDFGGVLSKDIYMNIAKCTSLTALELKDDESDLEKMFIIRHLPLESLELATSIIPSLADEYLSFLKFFPKLKYLSITPFTEEFSGQGLQNLMFCPDLHTLRLSLFRCGNCDVNNLIYLRLCPNLQDITLHNFPLNEACLQYIALSSLESLTCSTIFGDSWSCLWSFRECANLRHIDLEIDGLANSCLKLIVALFPRLSSVCLSSPHNPHYVNYVNDYGIRHLLRLPFLQHVKLIGFHNITSQSISLLRDCEYLRTLTLIDNKLLKPNCIIPLIVERGSLRHIEIIANNIMCVRKYVFKSLSLCVDVATDNYTDMAQFHGKVVSNAVSSCFYVGQ